MSAGQEVAVQGELTPAATEEQTGTTLVERALNAGVGVETIERLVALQERQEARSARAAYFEALAAFQEECPEIAKSETASIATKSGASYSYTYADLPAIARTIRPILKKHGLSYSFTTEPGTQGVLNVTCVLRHIDGHEERSTFPVPVDTAAKMSGAQQNGGAFTYGRRQSLIGVLGLTTADTDNDAALPQSEAKTLSDEQIASVETLLDEISEIGAKGKMLRWVGVDAIEDIPVGWFDDVIALLEKKRGAS